MSTHRTEVTAEPGAHDFTITRTFDAPPELVFRAWTDPDLVARWLGPDRLGIDVERWELRDGGRWRFTNTDTDGTTYGFHGVFHGDPSVEDGFLWTFEFEGWPGSVALERVTFTATGGGGTLLHTHSVHQSVAARDGHLGSGMEDGVTQGYAKLDALLAELAATV